MANVSTRMVILVAAAALSLVGAAEAAFADPPPGYSDDYGYDKNGGFNDGLGYDKNGVFDDGLGYTDGSDSTSGYDCDDNGVHDAYGIDNCGWYDGFFYPGFGSFVFDRNHHRHHMNGHQRDYFTRQARGPDGGRRVGLGSSGGVVPPGVSRPQGSQGSGMGFGSSGQRSGFDRGPHGGFGGGFGGSNGGMSGGFHGGGRRG